MTPYAPLLPSKTTSKSTCQFLPPLHSSHTKYPLANWRISLKMNSWTLSQIWSSAMLAHVLRHSFHISSTVELLLAGLPPEIVTTTGGWTSLAFLLYWHHMDKITPMSTSKAYTQAHLCHLASIFEEFCITHKIPSALFDKFTSP